MKFTVTITLSKADGSSGPKPDEDMIAEAIRDEIEGLEVWVDDYGYEITDMKLEENKQ